jgi:hypothetical protein
MIPAFEGHGKWEYIRAGTHVSVPTYKEAVAYKLKELIAS